MGKLPGIILAILALWLAWNVARHGPEGALGGVFDLLGKPQYGETDRPTRSGRLADQALGSD